MGKEGYKVRNEDTVQRFSLETESGLKRGKLEGVEGNIRRMRKQKNEGEICKVMRKGKGIYGGREA